ICLFHNSPPTLEIYTLSLHDALPILLRRPVGAGHGELVLVALELRGLHRTGLEADLDLGHAVGHRQPQVDQVDLAVAANGVDVRSEERRVGKEWRSRGGPEHRQLTRT